MSQTALHLAVSSGVPAIARHLVVCGASPVAKDLRGNTPLHAACAARDGAMVTHLTRPVTVSEVVNSQLAYVPVHTPGLLAADLTNYQGEQLHTLKVTRVVMISLSCISLRKF